MACPHDRKNRRQNGDRRARSGTRASAYLTSRTTTPQDPQILGDLADFQRLLQEAPELALALTRVLGDHLRESRPAAPDVRPAVHRRADHADASVPVIDLAARPPDPLRWHERVAVLDGSGVDAPRPGTTPAPAYRPLLDRAERMLLSDRCSR